MTGYIKVKRLNKAGNYKSAIDWDNSFKDKRNPEGLFKMVIQPRSCGDENVVKFAKVPGGYIVYGEAYIICKSTEKDIDKYIRKNFSEKWDNLVHREDPKLKKEVWHGTCKRSRNLQRQDNDRKRVL